MASPALLEQFDGLGKKGITVAETIRTSGIINRGTITILPPIDHKTARKRNDMQTKILRSDATNATDVVCFGHLHSF